MDRNKLTRIEIAGFKSIKDVKFDLHSMNVLIGANGSGKSNFVSFFKLLNSMIPNEMQTYVGAAGGASSLLYYGSDLTPQLQATLYFECKQRKNAYHMRLVHAAPDTLMFADESIYYLGKGYVKPKIEQLGAGHKETALPEFAAKGDVTARTVRYILNQCRVFQFHDTSENARIRKAGYIEDNRNLRLDGGNLAAFLYMLKETKADYYRSIVETVHQVAPFFGNFDLHPRMTDPQNIILNWYEQGSQYLFGPHQLSDGTLRAMALITLLLQPELPDIIILDEPELGLHPYALNILASLLRSASKSTQVILATQSALLVDQFEPEDVVVVKRQGPESAFQRLDSQALAEWLKEYSLSELWEKNVLGGVPGA